jgi:hypothetical protein
MPGQVLATSFVEPRGTIKSIIAGTVAREVAAAVTGVAAAPGAAHSGDTSTPLASGQLGYLAAFDDQIVMYRAKRGAFKPKPTEEVYATAPRDSVARAELERKKLSGVLTIRFDDGNEWAFDIPKIYLTTAEAIVRALTPT